MWSVFSVLLKFHPGTLGDNKYFKSSTMYKNKDTGSLGITNSVQQEQPCCDTIMQTKTMKKGDTNRKKRNSQHTWTHSEPQNKSINLDLENKNIWRWQNHLAKHINVHISFRTQIKSLVQGTESILRFHKMTPNKRCQMKSNCCCSLIFIFHIVLGHTWGSVHLVAWHFFFFSPSVFICPCYKEEK